MKIIIISITFVLMSKPAFAYFDPGAISLFFQLLIAGIVGAFVFLKFYYLKMIDFIKNIFKSKKKK